MWDLVYGPALSETGALSVLPQTHTHTLVPWVPQGRCPGSSLWPRGLDCHMRLDKGMVTVPPTLTAGVAHLEALPITFNEPHVSPGKKWYLGQVPSPRPCLSLSLYLLLPSSVPLRLSPTPPALFSLTIPPGARGLGNGAVHTSRSHCSTICFCLHPVGRRQERSKGLMRHCAADYCVQGEPVW